MTRIYLIRHAEAEGNLYRRIHGWYDSLVTENGLRQIQALQARFQDIHIDAVWSSDMLRTKTTARAVCDPKGLALQIDPDLRELHMGDWEDQSWGDVLYSDPDEMMRFVRSDPTWRAPNGEGLGDTGSRAQQALARIARSCPGQTIAVFCHGTAIRQILANIREIAPERWHTLKHSENTSVSLLTFEDGRFEILYDSDISHLDESIPTTGRQSARYKGMKPEQVNLRFRPLSWAAEEQLYLNARHETWHSTHVGGPVFLPDGFLRDAQEHLNASVWGVTVAMSEDRVAGLLQLDNSRYSQNNAGYIPFCYIAPELRDQGFGAQLIGKAISYFRPLGRTALRLRCAPYNDRAQHFYKKYGFVKIGQEQGSRVPLDILEKQIAPAR